MMFAVVLVFLVALTTAVDVSPTVSVLRSILSTLK